MNIIELIVLQLTDDFKNYPALNEAWGTLQGRQQEIASKWVSMIQEELNNE